MIHSNHRGIPTSHLNITIPWQIDFNASRNILKNESDDPLLYSAVGIRRCYQEPSIMYITYQIKAVSRKEIREESPSFDQEILAIAAKTGSPWRLPIKIIFPIVVTFSLLVAHAYRYESWGENRIKEETGTRYVVIISIDGSLSHCVCVCFCAYSYTVPSPTRYAGCNPSYLRLSYYNDQLHIDELGASPRPLVAYVPMVLLCGPLWCLRKVQNSTEYIAALCRMIDLTFLPVWYVWPMQSPFNIYDILLNAPTIFIHNSRRRSFQFRAVHQYLDHCLLCSAFAFVVVLMVM